MKGSRKTVKVGRRENGRGSGVPFAKALAEVSEGFPGAGGKLQPKKFM